MPGPETAKSATGLAGNQQMEQVLASRLMGWDGGREGHGRLAWQGTREMWTRTGYTYLTQMLCLWSARCVPPSKLNVFTSPCAAPKNHCRHPGGAMLLSPWTRLPTPWPPLSPPPPSNLPGDRRHRICVARIIHSPKDGAGVRRKMESSVQAEVIDVTYTQMRRDRRYEKIC